MRHLWGARRWAEVLAGGEVLRMPDIDALRGRDRLRQTGRPAPGGGAEARHQPRKGAARCSRLIGCMAGRARRARRHGGGSKGLF
jgi:hypothetical protein